VIRGSLDLALPKQLVTLAVGFDGQMFLLRACMTTKDSWLGVSSMTVLERRVRDQGR
jgi:hypothetical protein